MLNFDNIFKVSSEPDEALNDWNVFLEEYQAQTGASFNTNHPHISYLLKLFGNSRFLSSFLHRFPKTGLEVLESPFLKKEKEFKDFVSDIAKLESESWQKKLRHYKYKELLRITLKDFSNIEQECILREISSLAYAILQKTYNTHYKELVAQYGKPLNSETGKECEFTILGLGKLGGYELNYSSDVDLIAVSETGEGKAGSLSLHEFFTKLTQNFTKTLSQTTEDGFLYRVDWDLRPEGKAGVLVNSTSGFQYYYEYFGADWERQALTKANPVCGSEKLGTKILSNLEPFIYRKLLDIESITRLQEMKSKIRDQYEEELKSGFHVKLGEGGIREIEFFAQVHLMIFGGKKAQLRSKNTIQTLKNLKEAKLILNQEADDLIKAYLFLRKLENRLQQKDEAQTHFLSLDPGNLEKVACAMGYPFSSRNECLNQFLADLNFHRNLVHSIFKNLFGEISKNNKNIEIDNSPLKKPANLTTHYKKELDELFLKAESDEEKFNIFSRFKNEKIKIISELEKNTKNSRNEILRQLSLVAESICEKALEFATSLVSPKYGEPLYEQTKNKKEKAHLIGIAMGKMGGMEIGYHSDLDLIFVYSHEGETSGPLKITNSEFFAKVVQKFISILSTPTRFGKAYAIDTELRPSGNFGALVITLDGFLDYQKESQLWEKQAMLKARPFLGPLHLQKLVSSQIQNVLFHTSFKEEIKNEMRRLRERIELELAKENTDYFDFKKGKGGILDIEFIAQYFLMREGFYHPEMRLTNTFELLEKLLLRTLSISKEEILILLEAYNFFRSVESLLGLKTNMSLTRFSKYSPLWDDISVQMKFETRKIFLDHFFEYRDMVRHIFKKVFYEPGTNTSHY